VKYRVTFPSDPIITTDCHDRNMVKCPTGHPVAIATLKRLGCTVAKAEPFEAGQPCYCERLGEVVFVGHSAAWPGNSIVETTAGIIQRVSTDSLHPASELFEGTRSQLDGLTGKGAA
jgi:hypothetical protein